MSPSINDHLSNPNMFFFEIPTANPFTYEYSF